jgi:hypothetical protein
MLPVTHNVMRFPTNETELEGGLTSRALKAGRAYVAPAERSSFLRAEAGRGREPPAPSTAAGLLSACPPVAMTAAMQLQPAGGRAAPERPLAAGGADEHRLRTSRHTGEQSHLVESSSVSA